ncbi:hypothetical protein OV450_6046 [Actinobacteria bacterium OV450]|nr:hypothetical protein OV450_6046 [Actinobacteria bacterium OV450]
MAVGLTALPALLALSAGTPVLAATSKDAQPPVRYVQVSNTQSCAPDTFCTFTATCPTGTVVTGGGVSVTPFVSSGVYLYETEPSSNTSWVGTVRNASAFPVQVTVKAVCARLPGV